MIVKQIYDMAKGSRHVLLKLHSLSKPKTNVDADLPTTPNTQTFIDSRPLSFINILPQKIDSDFWTHYGRDDQYSRETFFIQKKLKAAPAQKEFEILTSIKKENEVVRG